MSGHDDAVRARFGETAAEVAEHAARQVETVREELREFLPLTGEERVLDSGTGAGVFALAIAPLVREVVGVDLVPELLAAARAAAQAAAPPNVTFLEGDATALPFEDASFDLAGSRRTLHHIARPELAVAELARVTRPGGRIFVDDQIGPVDPLAALALDRFERARDPSHARTLPDIDLRHFFEANGLVVERTRFRTHRRELGYYLDLAGCRGEDADRVRGLSPGGPESYVAETGWYLVRKPTFGGR